MPELIFYIGYKMKRSVFESNFSDSRRNKKQIKNFGRVTSRKN